MFTLCDDINQFIFLFSFSSIVRFGSKDFFIFWDIEFNHKMGEYMNKMY